MSEVEIVNATPDDIDDLARIHFNALPDDYLPSLGLDFLQKVYYPAALSSVYANTISARFESKTIGFATVSHVSSLFIRQILAKQLLTIVLYAVLAALRNPAHLLKSVAVLKSALFSKPQTLRGEIVFIAVDKFHRQKGIGELLITSALDYLKTKNILRCFTKTLESNKTAIGLYEKLGWEISDRFRLIGNDYVNLVSPPT